MTRSLACKQSSLNQADLKDWPVEERDCLTVRNNGEVNEGQDGESKKERERERERRRERYYKPAQHIVLSHPAPL